LGRNAGIATKADEGGVAESDGGRSMSGRLVGVGVGPGDPELLTVKGLRVLREADEVFVPVADTGEVGRAEATVREYLDGGWIRRLLFALSDDTVARERNWTNAAQEVSEHLRSGKTCAFATIGDPNVYSTFTYLARTVREMEPEVQVETVPGITALQDLASRSNTVLLEGDERLALLPFTAGEEPLKDALAGFETVVCYKGGSRLGEVLGVAEEGGRLEGAVYGARLGIEGEEVLPAQEMVGREGTYLSTVIFTDRGSEVG
jgi:precorrin-2/cobalt-factor-2 C20-methyltransferase